MLALYAFSLTRTPTSNQTEIVQTYVTYLRNASSLLLARGAKVIISSPTPTNPYDNDDAGTYLWAPTIYAWYSWYVADSLGGPDAGVYYVDHGDYGAQGMYSF